MYGIGLNYIYSEFLTTRFFRDFDRFFATRIRVAEMESLIVTYAWCPFPSPMVIIYIIFAIGDFPQYFSPRSELPACIAFMQLLFLLIPSSYREKFLFLKAK